MVLDESVIKAEVADMVLKYGAKFIPDTIERRIYGNLVEMLMGLLDKMSGKTLFTIFGHEFSFNIRPGPIVIGDD